MSRCRPDRSFRKPALMPVSVRLHRDRCRDAGASSLTRRRRNARRRRRRACARSGAAMAHANLARPVRLLFDASFVLPAHRECDLRALPAPAYQVPSARRSPRRGRSPVGTRPIPLPESLPGVLFRAKPGASVGIPSSRAARAAAIIEVRQRRNHARAIISS